MGKVPIDNINKKKAMTSDVTTSGINIKLIPCNQSHFFSI